MLRERLQDAVFSNLAGRQWAQNRSLAALIRVS